MHVMSQSRIHHCFAAGGDTNFLLGCEAVVAADIEHARHEPVKNPLRREPRLTLNVHDMQVIYLSLRRDIHVVFTPCCFIVFFSVQGSSRCIYLALLLCSQLRVVSSSDIKNAPEAGTNAIAQ